MQLATKFHTNRSSSSCCVNISHLQGIYFYKNLHEASIIFHPPLPLRLCSLLRSLWHHTMWRRRHLSISWEWESTVSGASNSNNKNNNNNNNKSNNNNNNNNVVKRPRQRPPQRVAAVAVLLLLLFVDIAHCCCFCYYCRRVRSQVKHFKCAVAVGVAVDVDVAVLPCWHGIATRENK